MKKFILMLLALGTTTAIMAQRGQNAYHGGEYGSNAYHDDYASDQGYTTTTYSNNYGRQGRNGYYNGGTIRYRGGQACAPRRAPRTRVRWEYSNCGRFRFRVCETGYWQPYRYVYRGGRRCRVGGGITWRQTSRRRYAVRGW